MKISIRAKLVIGLVLLFLFGLGGMLLTFLSDMGNETRKLEKSSAQLENEVGRFKVDSISET